MTPPKPRRPVCPALIVCDRIVVHPAAGKVDLIGAFDALVVPALPVRLAVAVSFAVTDGLGEYELELSMEHDQTESTIGGATAQVVLRSPVVVHQEAVPLELNLSDPGTFTVKLKANGDLIGQRAFTLLLAVPR